MSLNGLAYKFESVSALTGAGCRYSPDAFAPSSAFHAASALGDAAVYDNNAYGLFGNLFFEFRDTLNVKLFCCGCHILSTSLPTKLLSDKVEVLP